jgi:flagellar hook protein FlgE
MSFQTGLSGLNTASRNLDVIGNNIANANTVGMKASRAEFADLIASTNGLSGGNTAGIGTSVATVSQQFAQGNINITGNDLDVAINGGGFFQLTLPDGSSAYTRDGQFKLDTAGNIITNTGANVMGYPTDAVTGLPTSSTTQALTLPTTAPIAAKQTSSIVAEFNLDARAPVAASATPPTPRTTYGTSLKTYDAQGVPVPLNLYFERAASTPANPLAVPPVAASDNWNVYDLATGGTALFQMQFNSSGALVSYTSGTPTVTTPGTTPFNLSIDPPSGITPTFTAALDISKVTQYGASFAVSNLTQDGYTPGELVSLKIGEKGLITARYSNGQTQSAGQIALANFRNVQGLAPSGGGNWRETANSGQPVLGAPGQGKLGALSSGAVEESNVDLTAELVNMMTAQRAYQANAQTIKTQDQVMSTLVNLR